MSLSSETSFSPTLPDKGPEHTIPVAPTTLEPKSPLPPAVDGMDLDKPTHSGGVNEGPDHTLST